MQMGDVLVLVDASADKDVGVGGTDLLGGRCYRRERSPDIIKAKGAIGVLSERLGRIGVTNALVLVTADVEKLFLRYLMLGEFGFDLADRIRDLLVPGIGFCFDCWIIPDLGDEVREEGDVTVEGRIAVEGHAKGGDSAFLEIIGDVFLGGENEIDPTG